MTFEITRVGLAEIDTGDRLYRISTDKPIEGLVDSISHTGLINPPFLIRSGGTAYRVVSGFRRISACSRLGWKAVPARLFPRGCSEAEVMALAVADNAQHRELDLVEKARAVRKLSRFFENDRDLAGFGKSLGLSLSVDLVEKLRRIDRLSGKIKDSILSGAVPFTIALELEGLDREDAEAVSLLFDEIRPSLSQQREMLSFAKDIAGFEDRSIRDVIEEGEIMEIRDSGKTDRKKKLDRIRHVLKKRRYPALSRFEHLFTGRVKLLGLPDGVSLEPPPDFEGEEFRIHINFRSGREFKQRVTALARLPENPDFLSIVDKRYDDKEGFY